MMDPSSSASGSSKRKGNSFWKVDIADPKTLLLIIAATSLSAIVGVPAFGALIGCSSNPCNGTNQDDTIYGSLSRDEIYALGGNDWVQGSDGDDLIDGGPGNDRRLIGQGGFNTIYGRAGDDEIYIHAGVGYGHDGTDIIYAGSNSEPQLGRSTAYGGNNYDEIYGGWESADKIYGQADTDSLRGRGAPDYLDGGSGDDYIYGCGYYSPCSDPVYSDALQAFVYDDDTIYGRDGKDTIYGEFGNDNIWGGAHDDGIAGGEGDDTIRGEAGLDRISGEKGNDIIYGQAGGDTIDGGEGNDQIYGYTTTLSSDSDQNNYLYGDYGNDRIYGGKFDDQISPGPGADYVNCGPGFVDIIYGGNEQEDTYVNCEVFEDPVAGDPPAGDDPDGGNSPPPAPPTEEDTTPPVLNVPENIVVEATSGEQGAAEVTYTVTAQDNVDGTATLEEDGTTITQDDVGGDITMSCNPASGSVFPVGDTTVDCSATDEAGNEGTASFTVTVNAPPPTSLSELIDELISDIQNLDDDNVPQSVKTSLTAVLRQASEILNDDNSNNDNAVCGKLGAFINQVNANERRGTLTADQADDLRTQAEDIMNHLDC